MDITQPARRCKRKAKRTGRLLFAQALAAISQWKPFVVRAGAQFPIAQDPARSTLTEEQLSGYSPLKNAVPAQRFPSLLSIAGIFAHHERTSMSAEPS
jgi:hypothetical protein